MVEIVEILINVIPLTAVVFMLIILGDNSATDHTLVKCLH